MRIVKREFYNVEYSREIKIVPISDIQLSAKACREDFLKNDIEKVKNDPNCFWIGMGDYGDYINLKDPRFDFNTLADWAKTEIGDLANAQTRRLSDYFEPIAGKCLGMVKGNHEDAIHKYTGNDCYKRLCLDVIDNGKFIGDDKITLGYNGFIVLDFYRYSTKEAKKRVVIYVHHGYGGGRKKGGKSNMLENLISNVEADIIITGHVHDSISFPDSLYKIDRNGNLKQISRWGLIASSYLSSFGDGYDTYSEKAGYKPLALAWNEIILRPMLERDADRIEIRKGLR